MRNAPVLPFLSASLPFSAERRAEATAVARGCQAWKRGTRTACASLMSFGGAASSTFIIPLRIVSDELPQAASPREVCDRAYCLIQAKGLFLKKIGATLAHPHARAAAAHPKAQPWACLLLRTTAPVLPLVVDYHTGALAQELPLGGAAQLCSGSYPLLLCTQAAEVRLGGLVRDFNPRSTAHRH